MRFNTKRAIFAIIGLWSLLALSPASADDAESSTWSMGDWHVICTQPKGSVRRCVMAQEGIDKKSKKAVYRLTLARPSPGKPLTMDALLPLGVRVDSPADLLVDKGTTPVLGLHFVTCVKGGCIAIGKVNDTARRVFETGTAGRIAVKNPAGKAIELPISLKGFSAARKKLDEESAKK